MQYERRRIDLVSYFEAVRHAQQVQIDEIPLPSAATDISRMYPGRYIEIILNIKHNYATNIYFVLIYNFTMQFY